MYAVAHPVTGYFIFVAEDPREDGFVGDVQEGVTVDAPTLVVEQFNEYLASTPLGEAAFLLGRSPSNDKHFRLFRSVEECRAVGFVDLGRKHKHARRWTDVAGDAA